MKSNSRKSENKNLIHDNCPEAKNDEIQRSCDIIPVVSRALNIAKNQDLHLTVSPPIVSPNTPTSHPQDLAGVIAAQVQLRPAASQATLSPAPSPSYQRVVWANIAERLSRVSDYYPGPYDEVSWVEAWCSIRRDGSSGIWYFDRLYLNGILHCVGSNALLITPPRPKTAPSSPKYKVTTGKHRSKPGTSLSILRPIRQLPPSVLTVRGELSLEPTESNYKSIERREVEAFSSTHFSGGCPHVTTPPLLLVSDSSNRWYSLYPYSRDDEEETSKVFDRVFREIQGLVSPGTRRPNSVSVLRDVDGTPCTEKESAKGADATLHRPNVHPRTPLNTGKRRSELSPSPECSKRPRLMLTEGGTEGGVLPSPSVRPNRNIVLNRSPVGGSSPAHGQDVPIVMKEGIDVAKRYSINLVPGRPNNGNGNCFIESVIDQINSRHCYSETLLETPLYYRKQWVLHAERVARRSGFYPAGYTPEEWENGWAELQVDGVYEVEYFGDLLMPGVMHVLQKHALVFHTGLDRAFQNSLGNGGRPEHDAASLIVIRGDVFGGSVPMETPPLVLAYDGNHYESLIPATEEDIMRTQLIVGRGTAI